MILIICILSIILINLIILNILYSKKIQTKKGHEIFECNINNFCIGLLNPKFKDNQEAFCKPNLFNGNLFGKIKWVNSTKNLFCYYQIYGSSYVDENMIFVCQNYWITILNLQTKVTEGSARWSMIWKQPYTPNAQTQINESIPFIESTISASSGILQQYQNSCILIDYRQKNKQLIHIYHKKTFTHLDYEKYKKNKKVNKNE